MLTEACRVKDEAVFVCFVLHFIWALHRWTVKWFCRNVHSCEESQLFFPPLVNNFSHCRITDFVWKCPCYTTIPRLTGSHIFFQIFLVMVLKITRITQTCKTEKKWSKEELYSCTTSRLGSGCLHIDGVIGQSQAFSVKKGCYVMFRYGLFAPTDEGFYLCHDSLCKVAPKSLVNRSVYIYYLFGFNWSSGKSPVEWIMGHDRVS